MKVKFAPAVVVRIVVAFAMISLAVSCSDDDSGSNPGGGRGVVELGSQDYSSISLEIVGFPGGSTLVLRPLYWAAGELTEDPQARVTSLSDTQFLVEFLNLSADKFLGVSARILLAVEDSATDELQGIVVLCDNTGPIILSPECAGDCAPLCGLPGHNCDG